MSVNAVDELELPELSLIESESGVMPRLDISAVLEEDVFSVMPRPSLPSLPLPWDGVEISCMAACGLTSLSVRRAAESVSPHI